MDTVTTRARSSGAYQSLLAILLGLNLGVVFLDRLAFNLLAPMIQPEFGLTNTQIGMITGVLSATWALSSFVLSRTADATGRFKLFLVVATVVFSIASISSGLAVGLLTLMAARALMGFAEGGLPPLSTYIIRAEVTPERQGLAVGALSIGLNLAPLLGPIVIVGMGTLLGWREAFWIAGAPGLVLAALIWWLVRDPPRVAAPEGVQRGGVATLLRMRDIRLTILMAILFTTLMFGIAGFLPLYLVNVVGLSNPMMGAVMASQGAVMVAFGFLGPALSDRLGRRMAIFGSMALVALGYVILVMSQGWLPLVFTGAILAGAFTGAGMLIMVFIPGELAPPHLSATAMGLNAAIGEIVGAGGMPILIGWLSDQVGLVGLPWMAVGVCVAMILATLSLKETAPSRLRQQVAVG